MNGAGEPVKGLVEEPVEDPVKEPMEEPVEGVLGTPKYGSEVVRQSSARNHCKKSALKLYLSTEQGRERTETGVMVE